MHASSSSFWSDIKKYEELLKSNPDSYCFATLADVYLEAGLVDDAVTVARAGVARHPQFAAGQMALARACERKGLPDEALAALAVVTSVMPESCEAQQLTAKICRLSGRQHDAIQSLRTLLELNPDDRAARIELEALLQAVRSESHAVDDDDDLELIELGDDDIILELSDELVEIEEDLQEDSLVDRPAAPVAKSLDVWDFSDVAESLDDNDDTAISSSDDELSEDVVDDPMMTATVAELYLSQGFDDRAVAIYRALSVKDPSNASVVSRLAELEQRALPEEAITPVSADVAFELPAQGTADQGGAVEVLEGWLENIGRLRACR